MAKGAWTQGIFVVFSSAVGIIAVALSIHYGILDVKTFIVVLAVVGLFILPILISAYREKHDAIFQEGRLAFQNDVPVAENPYKQSDSRMAERWVSGWRKAQEYRLAWEAGRRSIKRPVWVWIIFLFCLYGSSWTLVAYYVFFTDPTALSQGQKGYFESSFFRNSITLDHVLTILLALISLVGAATLFLLRSRALHFFSVTLILYVLLYRRTLWLMVSKGGVQTIDVLGVFVSLGLTGAICVYCWKLTKRSVLR